MKKMKNYLFLQNLKINPKGPVNIYGNTGPGNLQRDRLLFWPFVRTGPPVILKHQSTGPPIISMLFFNGARDYFQVLRYGAMDYFQWCQLYGTNNYFSIFSRILYGTKDYFPDFSTGPMIFLPFLKKFSRFLEPYCQSLKWVWRHILSQSYDRFAYREIQICRPASGLARESKRHGRLSFDHGCQGHDFISIWICSITYF